MYYKLKFETIINIYFCHVLLLDSVAMNGYFFRYLILIKKIHQQRRAIVEEMFFGQLSYQVHYTPIVKSFHSTKIRRKSCNEWKEKKTDDVVRLCKHDSIKKKACDCFYYNFKNVLFFLRSLFVLCKSKLYAALTVLNKPPI